MPTDWRMRSCSSSRQLAEQQQKAATLEARLAKLEAAAGRAARGDVTEG